VKTLDNVIQLSIFDLKSYEVLTPGSSITLTWSRGNVLVQRTFILIKRDYLEMVGGRIYFDRTPCNYGGERVWFMCPNCDRRCAVLYGNDFVCRGCIGIRYYTSQIEDDIARAKRKFEKFKAKAFGNAIPYIRPARQHRRTHAKNLFYLDALEAKQNHYLIVALNALKKMTPNS